MYRSFIRARSRDERNRSKMVTESREEIAVALEAAIDRFEEEDRL